MPRRCDGDLTITHAEAAETDFVAQGFGTARHDLMYNDFVLVGPAEDPAGVDQTNSITEALTAIATAEAPFASRGDTSGTHQTERSLWSGVTDVDAASGEAGTGRPAPAWGPR